MTMTPEQKRAAAEFPKQCNCCSAIYLPATWKYLEFAYLHEDEFAKSEARHCTCKSTLQIIVEVKDLSEE